MRTLTTQEILRIDQRLANLKIYYLEIYHELRDHYFTELEKKSEEEFEATLQQLNETFAYSVVKSMQNKLKKATKKQITAMQWEMLKFWKLNNSNIFIVPLTLMAITLIYFLFDVEGLTLSVGIVSLFGIPISWYAIGGGLTISAKKFSAHFNKALSHQIFDKSGAFYAGIYWIYVGVNSWNSSNPGQIGTILSWLIVAPNILYMITLIRITIDWKKRKTYQVSQ